MSSYKKGNIIKGHITGIEKYGVFVNLDNYYNGLIHISEVSYGYVKNIHDYVKIGETIFVEIIDIDEETNKMKLSIKDIDYKIGTPLNSKIRETKSGFKTLEANLQKWIDDKS
jgi:general stress protein 13